MRKYKYFYFLQNHLQDSKKNCNFVAVLKKPQ